jgi:hypothetical protein
MKRVCSSVLALLLAGAAAPLAAGVVYVPIPPLTGQYEIQLGVSNADAESPRRFTANYLPLNADGSLDPRANPVPMSIPSARTSRLVIPASHLPGLLEVNSAPQLSYTATIHRVGGGDPLGAPLPIITSLELRKAGEFLRLQGIQRDGNGRVTDVAIANLGQQNARCDASLQAAGGQRLGDALLDLQPLSMAYFEDVAGLFGEVAATDLVLHLTCDQRYYAFGFTKDGAGGPVQVQGPAARGTSLLRLPGQPEPGPDPDPDPAPSPGGVLFTRSGHFHTTSPGRETQAFNIAVPPNTTFRRVVVNVDYTHGAWANPPNTQHSLLWLHRGPWLNARWNSNVFGYLNAWGPPGNRTRIMINADRGGVYDGFNGTGVLLQQGVTYRLEYVFDGAANQVRMVMTDKASGALVSQINGHTFGVPLRTDSTGFFFIYFGHEDHSCCGPERPSYGARWENLRLEFQN